MDDAAPAEIWQLAYLATFCVASFASAHALWVAWSTARRITPDAPLLDRVPPLPLTQLGVGVALLVVAGLVFSLGPAGWIAGLFLGALVACTVGGRDPVTQFGWDRGSWTSILALPLLLYFASLILVVTTALVSHLTLEGLGWDISAQEPLEAFLRMDSLQARLNFAIYAVILAPLIEETLFRGTLYPWLKGLIPRWSAILLTSALFGVAHWHGPAFLPLTAFGIVLILGYEATGTLWTPIVAHALFNGMTLVNSIVFREELLRTLSPA